MEMPKVWPDEIASYCELGIESGGTIEGVRRLCRITRQRECPESAAKWDKLLRRPQILDPHDQAEVKWIADDTLTELQGRQLDVITMRSGVRFSSGMILEEIGQQYRLTHKRIWPIEIRESDRLSHSNGEMTFVGIAGRITAWS